MWRLPDLEHILAHEIGEVWARITAFEGRDLAGNQLPAALLPVVRDDVAVHDVGLDFEKRVRAEQGIPTRAKPSRSSPAAPAPPAAPRPLVAE